jgi:dolichyl-phosphate-mannose--protein O-mannosyl transferase
LTVASAPEPAAVEPVERLREGPPRDRWLSWVVTVVIVALGFGIRLVGLGDPSNIIFDETYYAKDAWSLLQQGYEGTWREGANQALAEGDASGLESSPAFIVHPQVGKWLIAAGEAIFGMNSFGWRFSALVFGSLMIGLTVRLGRRLSRSTLIGALAGLLMTVDGLNFVMSRIGLLDIFQAFFILAGVSCLVADRDFFRHRLADRIDAVGGRDLGGQSGGFIFRPWQLAAGLAFGLACGTKWNSVYVIAVFGLLTVAWSVSARRLAGARRRRWSALWLDGGPAFVSLVLLSAAVYLASWASWLATAGGYGRQWGADHPEERSVRLFGRTLASLWQYHVDIYNFHTGDYMANVTHTYSSNPWGWFVLARPIGFDAKNGIAAGTDGCPEGGQECLRVISCTGTPLLWWLAALAALIGLVWWVAGADWRFGVTSLGVLATWLPWLTAGSRPLFFFYAITFEPFLMIGLAMVLGVVMGPARPDKRRQQGTIIVGSLVGLIMLDFAFIYPILSDQVLLRSHWIWRMWFPGWI